LQEIKHELAMANVSSRELARLSFRGLDEICNLLLPLDNANSHHRVMEGMFA
jgi:hypothetical protein